MLHKWCYIGCATLVLQWLCYSGCVTKFVLQWLRHNACVTMVALQSLCYSYCVQNFRYWRNSNVSGLLCCKLSVDQHFFRCERPLRSVSSNRRFAIVSS